MSVDEIYARSDAAHAEYIAAGIARLAARDAYHLADHRSHVAYVAYMTELHAARAVAKAHGVATPQGGEE
jgi:hypothetical protein